MNLKTSFPKSILVRSYSTGDLNLDNPTPTLQKLQLHKKPKKRGRKPKRHKSQHNNSPNKGDKQQHTVRVTRSMSRQSSQPSQ